MGERPITAAELETARATLTRGYPRNFETADQIARSVAQLALYELPDDYFATFVPRIAALDLERSRTPPAGTCILSSSSPSIVGDAERVAPTLGVLDLGPPTRIAAP